MAQEKAVVGDGINIADQPVSNNFPFYKLFSSADTTDIILMVLRTVAAIGSGISLPFMVFLFGYLINAFAKTIDIQSVVHEVSKVSANFVYLGIGNAVAAFLQVACWTTTGERQASRIRNLYLKSLLRRDIEFFDMETNTEEGVGKMSGDTVPVQDAMGEKVGKFIQPASSFFGGFVVAFFRGWQLTFVMMSCIPLVVLSAGLMATVMTKMATRGQTAYSEAAATVEENTSSIRTVASLTGEKQAVNKYSKSLTKACEASVLEGFASGMGAYVVNVIVGVVTGSIYWLPIPGLRIGKLWFIY